MDEMNRKILLLMMKFQPLLSTRSSVTTLSKFLTIIGKTINENTAMLIDKVTIDNIVEYFRQLFPDNFQCIDYIRKFGLENFESSKLLQKRLIEQNVEKSSIDLLISLRDVLIAWQTVHTNGQSFM
jgi:hypothetical protein